MGFKEQQKDEPRKDRGRASDRDSVTPFSAVPVLSDERRNAAIREARVFEMRQFLSLFRPDTASEALGLLRRAFPLSALAERVEACEGYGRHRNGYAA
jgi:hypothetical protein